MEYSFAYIAGFIVGLLLVAVVGFVFARFAHTDGKRKPKFDERQELIRGRGYKCAFFTILWYLVIYEVVKFAFDIKIMDDMAEMFAAVILGCGVYAGYTIWHDAYFALNEKRRSYIWLFVAVVVINLSVGIGHILDGSFIVDGQITFGGSANLLCGLMILVVLVMLLVKEIASRREDEG